ncbi:hypothetical protein MMC17_008837 [Xylographa soralifera]|nr:hypothetical protein [Xylographa soralifera]
MATTTGVQSGISVPQVIDNVWLYVRNQINTGNVNNIRIPNNFKLVIGQQGLEVLANRFRALIQAPVSILEDTATGVIRMYPTRNPKGRVTVDEAPEPQAPVDKKNKIPRPPNAFILYRQAHHPVIKALYPEMHNNQISVIMGKQWAAEDPEKRQLFRSMAEDIKKQHQRDNPGYCYQPRKPTDKKRRMSKKKAAALANMAEALTSTSTTSLSAITTSTSGTMSATNVNSASVPTISANAASQGVDCSASAQELQKTTSGNFVLTLGDEDVDDNQLLNLLESYNQTIRSPLLPHLERITKTPAVIYSERSEENQNDTNFFDAGLDFEVFHSTAAAAHRDYQELFDAGAHPRDYMTEYERTKLWDLEHGHLHGEELQRWAHMSAIM